MNLDSQTVENRTAEPKIDPYVPPGDTRPEFTVRAILAGGLFGALFGAVTVYVGLGGLTIAASIPIAVLSISLLRLLWKKRSILENNIIQTTGSAGESVAGGVIFTLPAFIFLGFELPYPRILLLAVIGSLLGIFFMIPLRRQLIVKEYAELPYPEGTACADVLIAGDRRISLSRRVFWGLGLGGVYTLFQNANILAAWPSIPTYSPKWLPGASLRANIAPEYLGVGYIIGPRIAGILFSGSVFAWLVMMPAIKFFGSGAGHNILPEIRSIDDMPLDDLRNLYLAPMGAGAVAAAGVITLIRAIPTIVTVMRARFRLLAIRSVGQRTDRDIGFKWAMVGACAPVIAMWLVLTFYPVARTPVSSNIVAAALVSIFVFLFVIVSSRITGLIGSSANPISGMTIASLLATCALFQAAGWTEPAFFGVALSVGAVVCIASANAGNSAQALKTGSLVGATPARQQVALVVGVALSVIAIVSTVKGINRGLEEFTAINLPQIRLDLDNLPAGVTRDTNSGFDRETVHVINGIVNKRPISSRRPIKDLVLLNVVNHPTIPDGQYFLNPKTRYIEVRWIQGIGSPRAPAPQARLMARVISGVLTGRLPLRLIMLGVFVVVAIELLGIRSLPFAVGFYIPIATTLTIFSGAVVRGLVDWQAKRTDSRAREGETNSGSLYASGLIAAGGIVGLVGVLIKLAEGQEWISEDTISLSARFPFLAEAQWLSIVAFLMLGLSLFFFACKPLEIRKAPREP